MESGQKHWKPIIAQGFFRIKKEWGGDHIIPVGWDEIISCFAGIAAVL